MAWYDSNWSNAFEVTTDPTKIPSSLTDFPVFLDLGQLGSSHPFWTGVRSDGGDIRITKSDGTTEVAREVVSIDTTAKTGEVHFIADGTLDAVSADTFRVYYGNASATEPAATATYGAQNVWNSDYALVTHQSGASATDVDDSTANDNDVASDGGSPSYDQAGKVGEAVDYDANDYLVVPDDASLDFDYNDSFTLSAWVYPETTHTNQAIISKLESSGNWRGWEMRYGNSSDNRLAFILISTLSSSHYQVKSNTSRSINTWSYFTCVYNGSSVAMYINGASVGTTTVTNSLTTTTQNATDLHVGIRNASGSPFDGKIDEIRISSVARSADWITTTHNCLDDPSTFMSYGSEISEPATGGGASTPPQAIVLL